jgi:hypothetical protein
MKFFNLETKSVSISSGNPINLLFDPNKSVSDFQQGKVNTLFSSFSAGSAKKNSLSVADFGKKVMEDFNDTKILVGARTYVSLLGEFGNKYIGMNASRQTIDTLIEDGKVQIQRADGGPLLKMLPRAEFEKKITTLYPDKPYANLTREELRDLGNKAGIVSDNSYPERKDRVIINTSGLKQSTESFVLRGSYGVNQFQGEPNYVNNYFPYASRDKLINAENNNASIAWVSPVLDKPYTPTGVVKIFAGRSTYNQPGANPVNFNASNGIQQNKGSTLPVGTNAQKTTTGYFYGTELQSRNIELGGAQVHFGVFGAQSFHKTVDPSVAPESTAVNLTDLAYQKYTAAAKNKKPFDSYMGFYGGKAAIEHEGRFGYKYFEVNYLKQNEYFSSGISINRTITNAKLTVGNHDTRWAFDVGVMAGKAKLDNPAQQTNFMAKQPADQKSFGYAIQIYPRKWLGLDNSPWPHQYFNLKGAVPEQAGYAHTMNKGPLEYSSNHYFGTWGGPGDSTIKGTISHTPVLNTDLKQVGNDIRYDLDTSTPVNFSGSDSK